MSTGIENLAWGLAERGVVVHILSGGGKPVSPACNIPENVNYYFTGSGDSNPVSYASKYLEVVGTHGLDCVIGWIEYIAYLAHIEVGGEKPKFVANEGRRPVRGLWLRYIKRCVKFEVSISDVARYFMALRKCGSTIDRVVCITNAVRENVVKYYSMDPGKCEVIHRGVNLNIYTRPRDESEGPVAILFTGNVSEAKGIGDLVEALRYIAFPVEVHLCGSVDSAYLEKLVRRASYLKPDSRVIFHGKKSPESLVSFYSQCDIFFFGSHPLFEGLGKSLIEAMACSCPVICTDIDVFKEVVVDGESGIMVPVGSPERIGAAVNLLVKDASLRERVGRNARETVEDKFSKDNEVERWVRLLGGLDAVASIG